MHFFQLAALTNVAWAYLHCGPGMFWHATDRVCRPACNQFDYPAECAQHPYCFLITDSYSGRKVCQRQCATYRRRDQCVPNEYCIWEDGSCETRIAFVPKRGWRDAYRGVAHEPRPNYDEGRNAPWLFRGNRDPCDGKTRRNCNRTDHCFFYSKKCRPQCGQFGPGAACRAQLYCYVVRGDFPGEQRCRRQCATYRWKKKCQDNNDYCIWENDSCETRIAYRP